MKTSPAVKVFLGLLAVVGFFYFVWHLYPVQNYVGRFMASDPKRSEQLYERFKNESDTKLLNLMQHGDFDKAGVAARILAERRNPDLYEKVFSKLKSRHENVRNLSRSLIVSLNREKAVDYFLKELSKPNLPKDARRQMIGILVNEKVPEVYPVLVKEAQRPDAWKLGLSRFFENYGDPKALPILQKMKNSIPHDNQDFNTRLTIKNIDQAIKKLEEIQLSNQPR
ncbi:MAG: hypothetical protein BWZ03_00413 [bacterium ADurb.BinA186]|nr:MAG: hypothetical protein BWZ03_00413 [bacterium ADurb.BinA186]